MREEVWLSGQGAKGPLRAPRLCSVCMLIGRQRKQGFVHRARGIQGWLGPLGVRRLLIKINPSNAGLVGWRPSVPGQCWNIEGHFH